MADRGCRLARSGVSPSGVGASACVPSAAGVAFRPVCAPAPAPKTRLQTEGAHEERGQKKGTGRKRTADRDSEGRAGIDCRSAEHTHTHNSIDRFLSLSFILWSATLCPLPFYSHSSYSYSGLSLHYLTFALSRHDGAGAVLSLCSV